MHLRCIGRRLKKDRVGGLVAGGVNNTGGTKTRGDRESDISRSHRGGGEQRDRKIDR